MGGDGTKDGRAGREVGDRQTGGFVPDHRVGWLGLLFFLEPSAACVALFPQIPFLLLHP